MTIVHREATTEECCDYGADLREPGLTTYVLELPSKGTIVYEQMDDIAWILGMHTEEPYRRQGVCTALFRDLCQRVRHINPGTVVADCATQLIAMMERESAVQHVSLGEALRPDTNWSQTGAVLWPNTIQRRFATNPQ